MSQYVLDAGGGSLYMNSVPDPHNINHQWFLNAHPIVDEHFPVILTVVLSRRMALDANGGQGGPYLNANSNFDNINHRWIVVPRHYPADIEHVTDFDEYCALIKNRPVFIVSKVGPCVLNSNGGQGPPILNQIPDWNINISIEQIPDLLIANLIWELIPIWQGDEDLECMITWKPQHDKI